MSTVLPNFCSDSDSIQRLTKDTSLGHVLKRSSMYRLIKKKAKFLLALSILAVLQSSCSATRSFCQRPESGEVEDGFDCYPAAEENSNFQAAIKMSQERERTFIMIKPDGVQRGLVGKIIQRFEDKGFKLVAMKFVWPSEELLQKHYADLSARPFFPGLVKYMSSGPVVPMVWEGLEAVKTGRKLLGETNPADSLPGTIRGDLCVQVGRNIIHGSDAVDSAKKEIGLWFTEKELVGWTSAQEKWVYED